MINVFWLLFSIGNYKKLQTKNCPFAFNKIIYEFIIEVYSYQIKLGAVFLTEQD